MPHRNLTPELLGLVAERLKVIADPARLNILRVMRKGERTVTEIVEATKLGQTNVSKHLQLLHAQGFVSRRKDGLFSYYNIADPIVFQVCELMCDSLSENVAVRRRAVAS